MWCCRCGVVLIAWMTASIPAAAHLEVSGYIGANFAHSSDLVLHRPGGADLFLRGLAWDGRSLDKLPPYWGVRGTYWLDNAPNWGVGIDYTHAKVYARLNGTANGSVGGVPIPANVGLNSIFSQLEFTDGLNLVTAHAFYRFAPYWRFTPYVGVGLGAAIPHVEVAQFGFPRTFEYQLTGVASRAYAGISVALYERFSSFAEYQFSYSQVRASLVGGGSLHTNLFNHHLNVGIAYSFGP